MDFLLHGFVFLYCCLGFHLAFMFITLVVRFVWFLLVCVNFLHQFDPSLLLFILLLINFLHHLLISVLGILLLMFWLSLPKITIKLILPRTAFYVIFFVIVVGGIQVSEQPFVLGPEGILFLLFLPGHQVVHFRAPSLSELNLLYCVVLRFDGCYAAATFLLAISIRITIPIPTIRARALLPRFLLTNRALVPLVGLAPGGQLLFGLLLLLLSIFFFALCFGFCYLGCYFLVCRSGGFGERCLFLGHLVILGFI